MALTTAILITALGTGADPTMVGISPGAARLLRLAGDRTRPLKERADAVAEIGKLRDYKAVPELLKLFPGNGDVLTLKLVNAFAQIGDPRALPALKKLRSDETVELPGKINVALDGAIRSLGPRK